jgi:uncharacterized protein (TIGR03089 family)
MATFATILTDLLKHDPGRPLVTFYDHASGERTELSVTTYANWVAKTGSLLAEELDLERGQELRIDLPTHWLTPVFLGAAWTVGLVVTLGDQPDHRQPSAVVCGPRSLDRWERYAADTVVVASALHPLGRPFGEPVPPGVHDFGAEVWSQPDAFTPWDPPGPDDFVLPGTSHRELFEAAAGGSLLTDGGRLFTEENPASPSGLSSFTEPFVRRGSVVLVAHPDPARVEETFSAERATARA